MAILKLNIPGTKVSVEIEEGCGIAWDGETISVSVPDCFPRSLGEQEVFTSTLNVNGGNVGGGSTGGQSITVNSIDATMFRDLLRRNASVFASSMAHAIKGSDNRTLSQAMSMAVCADTVKR